jgi:hypothetical protein
MANAAHCFCHHTYDEIFFLFRTFDKSSADTFIDPINGDQTGDV